MSDKVQRKLTGYAIVAGCLLATGSGIGIAEYLRRDQEPDAVADVVQEPLDEVFFDGLKELWPEFGRAESGNRQGVYRILSTSGKLLSYLYLEQISDQERQPGYDGPVEIAVLLDPSGKVCGVVLGDHGETPMFMKRVLDSGFLKRWNGLKLETVPSHKVDAVTGATFSSGAIRAGVRRLAEDYTGKGAADEEK